jgi:agmatinase
MPTRDEGRWPAFLGLPAEFTDPRRAAAAVIPVPYDRTSTWHKGADAGPRAILDASAAVELYDIQTRGEVWRRGVATLPPVQCDGPPEMLADLVHGRVDEVLARGQLPVVLGGEHSVTIGAVRAVKTRFAGVSVLQIDAHADTRETYEGSPFNHACVMARVREWCPIVQVGIRAIDAEEVARLDPARVFFAHDIAAADGNRAWMDRVAALLSDEVYVTIDVDGFDPSLVPATGTPEPGGLGWHQVNDLLARVLGRRRLVGFDVVELCPAPGQHASAFTAAKLAYRILSMALGTG